MISPADFRNNGFDVTVGRDIIMAKKTVNLLEGVKIIDKIMGLISSKTDLVCHMRQETFRDFTLFFDLIRDRKGSRQGFLILKNKSFDLIKNGKVNENIIDYIANGRLAWLPKYFVK
jgi:hypothetical protein